MDTELLDALEVRIATLMAEHKTVKLDNQTLQEENRRLLEERTNFKARIDQILKKLEGI